MKFSIAIIVTLFALVGLIECHPQSERSYKKGCTVDGSFVEAGSEVTIPGKCELVKCAGLNKVVTTACQEKSQEEKCFRKTADLTKPFPSCCPEWICN